MKRSRCRVAVITGLVAGLLGCVLVATPAQAAAAPTPEQEQEQAQQTARYWLDHNLRNMRLAEPVVEPVRLSSPTTEVEATPDQLLNGDQSQFRQPTLPPAVGRVFFVDEDGEPRWCSGVALSSAHRNLVATAGQCAGQQLDRWVFVPGYAQYRVPHGVFVGAQSFTHYDWSVYEDADRNYGFVAVHDGVRLDGRHLRDTGRLADAVPAQGFAWNHQYGRRTVLGYSAGWPVGFWVRALLGAPVDETFAATSAAIKGEELVGIRPSSPFTNSLGSAWLLQYDASSRLGYLNGITIATSDGLTDGAVSLSATFDAETRDIYQQAGQVDTGSIL